MTDLKGRGALVTGAASGIGLATAKLLSEHGASVAVVDLNQEAIDAAVASLKESGAQAIGIRADVSKEVDMKQMVATTVKQFGRLDIAVNNAGIGGAAAPIGEYPTDAWNTVIGVNLTGVFLGMKHEIAAMGKRGGAIVNVASILGFGGFAQSSAYVAAKHGVIGLTQNAALEYAAKGIRVNAVAPGFIETPLLESAGIKAGEPIHDMLVTKHPIGRLGQSNEVAEAILWLVSDGAAFVNGSTLVVDGGYLAQ